jgi:hypothetical protein
VLHVNPAVAGVVDPPVTAAKRWIEHATMTPDTPLLDLSQAVPSYPPAPELRAFLAEVVRRPDTSGYAPVAGLRHTRDAVASHFARAYGAIGQVHADDVMITTGCNQAFCLAVGALCGPGDEVVLPTPYYFNHDMWLHACRVGAVHLALSAEHSMVPDPTAVEELITARTRAIVLVTPNNPCGVTYPPEVIEAVFDIARQHGIALILDETYKDFRSTTDPPHGLFARAGWRDTLVHLYSFSKMLSLAGYRAGSLVAAPHVLDAAAKLADCETIGAPRVSQEAVAFGLSAAVEPWVEDRRRAMCERVELLDREMAAAPGGFEVVTSGAFFAYVRHPFGTEGAAAVARRLAVEHNLLTIPGDAFGRGQDRYLRLAFGNVDGNGISAAAERLASCH